MDALDDEIFYSDDELSDSEIFSENQTASSYLHTDDNHAFEKIRQRQNSSGALSPPGMGTIVNNLNNTNNTNQSIINTINSPVNQISTGIANLLRPESQRNQNNRAAQRPQLKPCMSYSAITRKEPISTSQIKVSENPRPAPMNKTSVKVMKSAPSAITTTYRFRSKSPHPDTRFPADQQLVIGPIPGHLDHDLIYNSLRGIFQSRGAVCFMFVHKSAVKDDVSGKQVKFGYVVFAEKGVAQKVLKEGSVTFGGGHKIKVTRMNN